MSENSKSYLEFKEKISYLNNNQSDELIMHLLIYGALCEAGYPHSIYNYFTSDFEKSTMIGLDEFNKLEIGDTVYDIDGVKLVVMKYPALYEIKMLDGPNPKSMYEINCSSDGEIFNAKYYNAGALFSDIVPHKALTRVTCVDINTGKPSKVKTTLCLIDRIKPYMGLE